VAERDSPFVHHNPPQLPVFPTGYLMAPLAQTIWYFVLVGTLAVTPLLMLLGQL